jgi:hypothetical protein
MLWQSGKRLSICAVFVVVLEVAIALAITPETDRVIFKQDAVDQKIDGERMAAVILSDRNLKIYTIL